MSRPDAPPAGSKRTSARRWTLLRSRKEARSSTSNSARLGFGRGRRGIVEDLGAVAILRIALPLWWDREVTAALPLAKKPGDRKMDLVGRLSNPRVRTMMHELHRSAAGVAQAGPR